MANILSEIGELAKQASDKGLEDITTQVRGTPLERQIVTFFRPEGGDMLEANDLWEEIQYSIVNTRQGVALRVGFGKLPSEMHKAFPNFQIAQHGYIDLVPDAKGDLSFPGMIDNRSEATHHDAAPATILRNAGTLFARAIKTVLGQKKLPK